MTPKPITIDAQKPLSEAARIMHDRRIHRLFVLNDRHELVGVITASDVLRAMARAQEGEHPIVSS
jgi:CBS domain-containing protein